MTPKDALKFFAAATPAQCREMGELLLHIADMGPRDAARKALLQQAIDAMPDAPESSLADALRDARARVAADHDALRATGWHPDQMRAKLEELGYTGTVADAAAA